MVQIPKTKYTYQVGLVNARCSYETILKVEAVV
jgi:hypothetical protein